jgi:hypothetical protein
MDDDWFAEVDVDEMVREARAKAAWVRQGNRLCSLRPL